MNNTNGTSIKKKWNVSDIPDLSNKIIIVTGANSGIGFEVSKALASKNAEVIMACRNQEKGLKAADTIKQEVPHASLKVMALDLADLSSIREFASKINNEYTRLDILLNNAGVMQTPQIQTKDGFELQLGTNHLGHFALTGLLLDLLLKTDDSRVVTMSSLTHKMAKIDFEDIMLEDSFSRNRAYGNSKLANLLFTYEFQRRLEKENKSTISVAAHPGYSNTNLQQSGPGIGNRRFFYWFYKLSNRLIAQSAEKGALPILCAATDRNIKGGNYIGPKRLFESRGSPKKVQSNKQSHNEEDARKLWEISEELTGVKFLS